MCIIKNQVYLRLYVEKYNLFIPVSPVPISLSQRYRCCWFMCSSTDILCWCTLFFFFKIYFFIWESESARASLHVHACALRGRSTEKVESDLELISGPEIMTWVESRHGPSTDWSTSVPCKLFFFFFLKKHIAYKVFFSPYFYNAYEYS